MMAKLTTEVKTARARVAAPKATPKVVAKTPPKAEVKAKVQAAPKHMFHLKAIARPKEGARLYAHTQAVFEVLGMFRGKTVERPRLVAYIGMKATCYHVSLGNLREAGSTVAMTEQGKTFYAARRFDKEVSKGFVEVFKTGKPSDVAGVKAFQIEALQ
jgi:hypothetical protein